MTLRWFITCVALCHPFVAQAWDVDGCTTIVVSAGASADGSAMTSHANDCQDCDARMIYVPARDHPEGSMRTVYTGLWDQYPRLVDPTRSPQYVGGAGINATAILGYIPEVPHTYALWEASYGVMNEHGLGLGESTTPGYLVGTGREQGGHALFSVGNLMAVALERCKTARCGIQTMGDLAAKYGFYGEDPGQTGGGETVTLVDKSGEAWVFHIVGGVSAKNGSVWEPGVGKTWKDQRGCLWVAQRLPEGHVAVVANAFTIGDVDFEDTEYFLYHPGLRELAVESGYWDGNGKFNWQKMMSPDPLYLSYFPGMAPIPMYSTLRMWTVYTKAAPALNLQPTPVLSDFPFSVPAEKKVSNLEVMNWFRDHYEGTEFDLRLGALAGPFQSPNRIEGGKGAFAVPGQFARAISISRTSYAVICQSGSIDQPLVWFAPDAPASSVFVPFFTNVLAHGDGKYDVDSYGSGSMKTFSFHSEKLQPAWWAHDFVANWMDLAYNNMSMAYVYPKMHALQDEVITRVRDAASGAGKANDATAAAAVLGKVQSEVQRSVTKQWWELAEMLVVRYNDNHFNFPDHSPTTQAAMGYPAFWLEMIGYNQEHYKPHWFGPSSNVPTLLPAEQRQQALKTCPSEEPVSQALSATSVPDLAHSITLVAVVALVGCATGLGMGWMLWGRRASTVQPISNFYTQIA